MPIRFYCPLGHRLQAPETQEGKLIHCPACRQRVIVPLLNWQSRAPSQSLSSAPQNPFDHQQNRQVGQGLPLVSSQEASLEPATCFKAVTLAEFEPSLSKSSLSPELALAEQKSSFSAPKGKWPEDGQSRQPLLSESGTLPGSQEPLVDLVWLASDPDALTVGQPNRQESGWAADLAGGRSSGVCSPSQTLPATAQQPGCLEELSFVQQPSNLSQDNARCNPMLEEIQTSGTASERKVSAALPTLPEAPSTNQAAIVPLEPSTSEAHLLHLESLQELSAATLEKENKWKACPTGSAQEVRSVLSREPSVGDGAAKRTGPQQTNSSAQNHAEMESLSSPKGTLVKKRSTTLSAPCASPRSVALDPARSQEARWLGIWLGMIVLFSIGPAFRYLMLSTAPGWARTVVLLGLWELAYVAWMILSVHRIALWIVMVVFAAGATLSAVTTAFTLVAPGYEELPWGLGQIRRWAPSWFGCVLAVQTLGAYLAGRLAFLWGQMDRRLARHRLTG
ncbi:MAG: hypothetical protein NZ602_09495 [Thermoguttaceae bacterium]|nr:hypothetical protein [Thermoguttaceae bacterium]MDW8039077.1 hypothetical protein [Thermoguttaceae bacterium]